MERYFSQGIPEVSGAKDSALSAEHYIEFTGSLATRTFHRLAIGRVYSYVQGEVHES